MNILTTVRGLLLLAIISAPAALGASNGLDGEWSGHSESIYPDGTRVPGLSFDGYIVQEQGAGLFWGAFTYSLGDIQVSGFVTGYMGTGGMLSGLLSVVTDDGATMAVATVDGKLNGNEIVAVTRDFSDGTTSILTAYRVR